MKLVLGPKIGSKNCRYSRKNGISDADISGIECKSKQTGRSEQTAELLKSIQFSCPTTLHCISEALSLTIAKSQQTAELIKSYKFSLQTPLL